MTRVHLRVFGRVQGVWYRGSAQRAAVGLGLGGWVRNRSDGTVEAVAEGPEDAVEAFVQWCHRGPELATVEGVEVSVSEPVGLVGHEFQIRPTL